MSDSVTERTPPVIAVEINMIKQQTEKVVLNNAIEIGRRLKNSLESLQQSSSAKGYERMKTNFINISRVASEFFKNTCVHHIDINKKF